MALVKFVACTAAEFAGATHEDSTLYFLTDAQQMYKGDKLFTGGVYSAVTAFPATGVLNTLYVNTDTGAVKFWNGTAYTDVVVPQETIAQNAEGLATAKAVYDYVSTQITDLNVDDILTRLSAAETDIDNLQKDSHTHANKDVLDGITAAKVTAWDAKVASVKAADASVTVGGTATDPTVGVKISAVTDNALTLATDGLKVVLPEETDYTVTIAESSPEGYAKAYTLSQLGKEIGTINIPKDMVVSSGTVETDPAGQTPGTYLVLTLANATNDKVYVNVGDLIEYVTSGSGENDAVQVQVSNDHKVTATIKAASITKAMLDSNVQASLEKADTAMQSIAEKSVSKAMLAEDVQNALDAAGTALQKADITTGATNGTIAVDGTDVAVHGLGSAAYTESNAYATAAQGAKADTAVQEIATGSANGTISVDGTDVAVKGLGSAAYTESSAYDASGAAAQALADAKKYVDDALTWGSL